ncbi:MAG: aspartate aminotransferase family protein [Acidobacteria bacterium]|nr:aspartate aminotransferase family protein [Acidobacteriota bacterium]
MKKDDILKKQKEFLFPCTLHYYSEPLPFERGKGQYLWDTEGKKYLDFFGGIVTISVGHCNDAVVERIVEQVRKLQHTSTLFPHANLVTLAETMARITPGDLDKSFFTNSGTEANETAIEVARAHTGNFAVIALRHAYSGRSNLAATLTGQYTWKKNQIPAPGIVHAHNAYCYRCPFDNTYPSCNLMCATDMKELIETATSGAVAAFIAEPIQGIGGFITPPKEYFEITSKIVRDYGGLLISDEVQTGFGRTGKKWFGMEHYNVQPDIMTFAKGMANGVPIGATITRTTVADSLRGLTISTFGGNPVTAAAANAVIEYIEKEQLVDHAAVVGSYLRQQLLELQDKYPLIGDVRGMGLMWALELVKDRKTKEPAPEETSRVMEQAKNRGLIVGKGGLYGNVLRISPPLTISKADVDAAVRLLDQAFSQVGHPVSG